MTDASGLAEETASLTEPKTGRPRWVVPAFYWVRRYGFSSKGEQI